MKIYFYLRYHTHFGQTIFITGNTGALGNDNRAEAFALSYLDNEFWYGSIEILDKKSLKEINYRYILREEGEVDILDADTDRVVDPTSDVTKDIGVIDTWNAEGNFENVFYTLPFQKHLLKEYYKKAKNMIYTKCIKIIFHLCKTLTPPCIIILLHFFPIVRGKSPILSLYSKIIRRSA
jgi:4-alpha-glucanotransferase